MDTKSLLEIFQKNDELKIIEEELDIELEIPHLAYVEIKKESNKALLFKNPIHIQNGKKIRFEESVLMNVFGTNKRLNLIVQKDLREIAEKIKELLNLEPPKKMKDKLKKIKELWDARHIFPKKYKKKASCQEIIIKDIDLYKLPILKTWEEDGGRFITMGQVYTTCIEGKSKNLGMYRMQVHSKDELIMHWQIHKDSAKFFEDYKKANKLMPVSIAIGGDPLYIWCGQAPLPPKMFELSLYGIIRGESAKMAKCISNELSIPHDCDIVIEGYVDPNNFAPEGKFGDHTGFYTPIEPYPVLKVKCITKRKDAIYTATVVGKPPLEDKYMGYMTGRVFLPLMQMVSHGLIDYEMPENGVFHNLIIAKIDSHYPGGGLQAMSAFFGLGQMSFVKHAILLDYKECKEISIHSNYKMLCDFILERINHLSFVVTKGVCDALDHACVEPNISGKLGLIVESKKMFNFKDITESSLLEIVQSVIKEAQELHIYPHKNKIIIISINKVDKKINSYFQELSKKVKEFGGLFIFVDSKINEFYTKEDSKDSKIDLRNYYMLIWRITNSIDVSRDFKIENNVVFLDATSKNHLDEYEREWPKETLCSKNIIKLLQEKNLINEKEEFFKKFEIL